MSRTRRGRETAASIGGLFGMAEPHLIGVWKFQERGESPKWAATVLVDGSYFDVAPSDTIGQTLQKVLSEVEAHRGRHGGQPL